MWFFICVNLNHNTFYYIKETIKLKTYFLSHIFALSVSLNSFHTQLLCNVCGFTLSLHSCRLFFAILWFSNYWKITPYLYLLHSAHSIPQYSIQLKEIQLRNVFIKKIPSEMEVAPRYIVLTLFTRFILFKLLYTA